MLRVLFLFVALQSFGCKDVFGSISSVTTHNHNSNFSKDLLKFFEKKYNIPKGLLSAICYVESRNNPWVFNSRGVSYRFSSKNEALKSLERIHKNGFQNNHIGCMQINWPSHKRNFKNIDQLLIPYNNIEYAAKLLVKGYKKNGSWEKAVQYYNSSPKIYKSISYQEKVFRIWKTRFSEKNV